jgi:hypothetical protein
VHGGSTFGHGAFNTERSVSGLVDYFAKGKSNKSSSSSKGRREGNYKKLSSNDEANKYARSKGYKDAHALKKSFGVRLM